jgi:hypothetical protein
MDRRDTFDVFYSYSHRDADLRGELDVHLALLRRQEVIRTWWDGEIQAGEEWSPEIFGRLEKADVILLLISPDFIASDFCWSKEMTRAMERHEAGTARVIPVLLRPVDNWQKALFGKLQGLPPGGKAVTEHANRDVALRDVAAGIRTALEHELRRRAPGPEPAGAAPLRVVILIGHSLREPLPEAAEMAKASASGRDVPVDVSEVIVGASQLYRLLQSTGQFKRAMLLAVERGMSYREYADSLNEGGSLDAMDELDAARRTTAFEVRQLAALEPKHGFSYGAFLKVYYPVIARAAYFTGEELEGWFGDRLVPSSVRADVAYKNGLTYLVRLNYLLVENRDGDEVFTMPPNQRWSMRALSDPEGVLPEDVPLRGARERLSLALDRAGQGDLDAVGDLLLMEGDYRNNLDNPPAAAAVFYSMLVRAELERVEGPDHALVIQA